MGKGALGEFLKPDLPKVLTSLLLMTLAVSRVGTDMCEVCSVPAPSSRPGLWLVNWDIDPTRSKTGELIHPSFPHSKFVIKTIFLEAPYYTDKPFPVSPADPFFIPPAWVLLLNLPYWYALACLACWWSKRIAFGRRASSERVF